MRWLLSFLLTALLGTVQALSITGSRVLVVIDDVAEKDKYSQFWQDLESRGFTLKFQTPKTPDLSLLKLGALAYDHLLLLPSKSKGLGPNLTPNLLVDYIQNKGNILLTLSGDGSVPSSIASTLLEFDITLPPEKNSVVVDHFSYDKNSAAEKHDVILSAPPSSLRGDLRSYFHGARLLAVPRAVGQVLGNSNPLLAPILRAPETAYAYDPKESEAIEDVFASGSQLSLVTAFQARNSARLTVLGSAEMLENKWFDAKVLGRMGGMQVPVGNREFAERLSMWTFQEIGVLQVGRLEHHLNEPAVKGSAVSSPEINPDIYRIKNDVSYSIELSEWDVDSYKPFTPPGTDKLQLEFSMLSPFHRLDLTPTSKTLNSTIYSTSFRLPDQHGIFNFLVNYKRPFMTNIYEKRTVTVRHFAHDEWPRSFVISGAYPWVAGIGVTVTGWVLFVGIWLYSKPTETSTKKTQ
ncbi:Dolichyl-diphosphooligosaccharide-protein glycosyltransferase 48kDa subunit [Myriangium duriaei CBS 260.36]|uniref:Dolichyl-diphosphooligosaccharide--protein glycosyltransferase subunit WBP1 n=1 Tax=Myriangium duriaei CBS 260.36 TaxID=1168546 RepID=A0A9P4J6H8_9PEZI|nr:Dolichyl-diphosphooligosaccharide-protein glycosyltransferase 48kDa subunit [Myriangium duriaei CBS 260.36]